jgi:hypothetical protein
MTRISANSGKPGGRWTTRIAEIGGRRPTWQDIAMLAASVLVGVGLFVLALIYM